MLMAIANPAPPESLGCGGGLVLLGAVSTPVGVGVSGVGGGSDASGEVGSGSGVCVKVGAGEPVLVSDGPNITHTAPIPINTTTATTATTIHLTDRRCTGTPGSGWIRSTARACAAIGGGGP